MPPSPLIQCYVDDWKEKIQPTFSNIDHGGRGERRTVKMAKNVKSLIIFARDCRCRTERFSNSFIPAASRAYNNK
jgi:hypothetical protein